jgi:hypothetical protein
MYNDAMSATAAGAGATVLAATGLAGDVVWFGLAAFAMIAVGTAIMRIVPRRLRNDDEAAG